MGRLSPADELQVLHNVGVPDLPIHVGADEVGGVHLSTGGATGGGIAGLNRLPSATAYTFHLK